MVFSEIVDILLVEDNPDDVELMLRALKKNKIENPVYVVKDGEEALDFIFCRGLYEGRGISRPPKVIFLDLKLPKLSGLEVLKVIKSDERTRVIPVVVVTSSKEDPDIKTAYAIGANSYVVKPVDFDSFFKIAAHLGLYWLLVNRPPED
ncbi:MAG TPA: response regulator [Syntrophorhabdaceae bacterium]|nr:response regulator [Syntrophorhabdaceae bacterium]HPU30624.1 response regulator [Syntrophorhabdaceae bacterium]